MKKSQTRMWKTVVIPGQESEGKAACTRAIQCAKCMLQVAHGGINPILNQYDCPQMNIRIGIDLGENAVIQSGWDIHPNLINVEEMVSIITSTRKVSLLSKNQFMTF